jgi:hypothetical protein
MTETSPPEHASLADDSHLTANQEQAGAPQVRRRRYHAVTPLREPFGQPSNYSLPAWELARHVRQLRRQGWQSWEIRLRFDLRRSA